MKFSRRERLRYWFDRTMSKGAPALVGWLAVAMFALVLVMGVVTWGVQRLTGNDDRGLLEFLWLTLLRAMDPGTISGDAEGATFLTLMFLVTMGGIFVFSALVGVIATGLDSKLNELRKGRSRVLETGHTVLLGWSDQVFTMISELVEANASERRSAVAILADKDKVEMEDEIRERVGDTRGTRVVCRTGDPIDPADLEIVNPGAARSIIVLTPDGDDPDAHVIKTLLAINNRPGGPVGCHIVATVGSASNLAPARIAGGPSAHIVDSGDIAARLVVQSARQSGLSTVYTDLLDFSGDEIYMTHQPMLTGHTFEQVLFAYDACSVIGLRRPDGGTLLNPPMRTVIGEGDQLILIAEDDSTVRLTTATPHIDPYALINSPPRTAAPERILMLGWHARAPMMTGELDAYVQPGSTLDVIADPEPSAAEKERLALSAENLTVTFTHGDTADRVVLEKAGPGTYDYVIVLGSDDLEVQRADSRTLVTLLHLRDMEATRGERYSVVSEMADDRNRTLAQVTEADDFVVSDKLISLLMTQISENRHLASVYDDLFSADGSEVYLKPAEDYVAQHRQITCATVVEAARRRGEVAIGFRLHAQSTTPPTYGVVLNPPKHATVMFAPGDRIIVLAED